MSVKEFDYRPTCPACKGETIERVATPPRDGRKWEPVHGQLWAECGHCKGEGKIPMEPSGLELETTDDR